MNLPLGKRLKKRQHVEIALLQDELVEILYERGKKWIFHGGTCIWRCYFGNRFSEDLDFYGEKSEADEQLKAAFEARGFVVSKFKLTENLLFCKVSNGTTEARLEVNFAKKQAGVLSRFEKTDGMFVDIFALSCEELLLEKLAAFRSRRFIRDIYDVYHLSSFAASNDEIRSEMRKFFSQPGKPVDERNLKALVYVGAVPSFEQMFASLQRRWQ